VNIPPDEARFGSGAAGGCFLAILLVTFAGALIGSLAGRAFHRLIGPPSSHTFLAALARSLAVALSATISCIGALGLASLFDMKPLGFLLVLTVFIPIGIYAAWHSFADSSDPKKITTS